MHAALDADTLLDRAQDLIAAGRGEAAWPVLQAAQTHPTPRWAELAALLHLRAGQTETARALLDTAIAAAPTHAGLRRLRAETLQRLGALPAALADAAEAVILNRTDPTAKALLGTLLLQSGQTADAIACLAEAVASAPHRPSFRRGLAAAWEAAGNATNAAAALEAGITAIPQDIALRNDAVLLAVRQRDFHRAVELAEAARQDGAVDACLFGLRAHALSQLGQHAEAAVAYQDALRLGPEDPYVRHLAAAAGLAVGGDRAPAEYVRTVFDGYASRFDSHILGLGYRVPGLLRRALLAHLPPSAPPPRMLDLGCGTGLLGVVLSDLPRESLEGVDLSAGMLEEARAKGCYTSLHEADLLAHLRAPGPAYPIILAGDVLCYFGDLAEIFTAVATRLAPGGLFLCSLEEQAGEELTVDDIGQPGWQLGRQGRYTHQVNHILTRASEAGLALREIVQEPLRQEAGADVAGLIVVLERRA